MRFLDDDSKWWAAIGPGIILAVFTLIAILHLVFV